MWSAVSTAIFSVALIAAVLPTAASAVGTVPPAPTGVVAVAGNGTLTVSWVTPSSDGGSAITGFTATASPGGSTCTGGATATSCTSTIAATNGTSYTVTVTATNINGTGPASAPSSPVTPGTTPGTPGDPVPAGTGVTGEATVTWAAPATSGGSPITGYTVVSATGTPAGGCTSTGATTCTATGLSPTSSYTFKVKATNSFGSGSFSGTTGGAITPSATPGAATAVTATPGDGQLVVAWTAPTAVPGAPLTGYTVSASPGGQSATASASATSATITGLTNGVAYTLTLVAANANGNGSPAGSAGTPGIIPGVPSGVTATATGTSGQVTVKWLAPASFGGSAAPGTGAYTATASNGASCKTGTANVTTTTCNISTGLTDGSSYTVTVHATNAIGSSSESAPSSVVVPGTVPGAPTSATATATGVSGAIKVGWTAPSSSGGPAITSYKVTETAPGTTNTCTSTSDYFCTVTGLTDGTAYTFGVVAINAIGPNATPASTGTGVAPSTVPGAPTGLTASAVSGTGATLTWVAPVVTGSSTITGYTLTVTPSVVGSPFTVNGTTFTKTFTGMSDGTVYTFTVHATNGNGNGAESSAVSVTPSASTPSAPQTLTATPVTTQVTVGWALPVVVGSSAPSYVVTVTPSVTGSPFAVAAGTFTKAVTGLTDGTSYTFAVAAKVGTNTAGPAASITQKAGVLPSAPGDPTVSALTGSNAGTLWARAWTAPTTAGTGGLTTYMVKAAATLTTAPVQSGSCSIAASALLALGCNITGLSNGFGYSVTVVAMNAIGTGPANATPVVLGVTTTAPGAPTGVTATSNTSGASTVAWTAPADNGGTTITNYTVTATEVGSSPVVTVTKVVGSAATTTSVTGLTNGKAYTFQVKATNGTFGANSTASAAATPSGTSAAPTGITGVIGNGQVNVSWTAPVNTGGSAIIGYKVVPNLGNSGCTTTGATTCNVSGLANGSAYTFTVTPQTSTLASTGGFGASAVSGSLTPADVPGQPTNVSGTAGNGQVAVTWNAPSSNGSSAIILYTVTASPGGATCLTSGATAATCTVTGLTNGTYYTMTVTATNATGVSLASAASASVQPRVGAALDTSVNHSFSDVSGLKQASQDAIAAINNLGITVGTNGGATYSPAASVTREQMALFLSRSVTAVGQALNSTVTHSFSDVSGLASGSQDAIAAIYNLGVTTGTNGGATYSPAGSVTREQMAAFVGRTWVALGGACDNTVNHSFGDLNGNFADPWVACISNLGVTTGTSSTTYSPSNLVTREQMALFLYRLVDLAVAEGL